MRWSGGLRRLAVGAALCCLLPLAAQSQDTKAQKAPEPEKKPAFQPPLVRLTSAKTAFLKRTGGNASGEARA